MKAIIAIAPDESIHSGQTSANPDYEHCLIKFNTPEHALSETEMTYSQMARQCGITMMDSRLIEVEGVWHFLTRRFIDDLLRLGRDNSVRNPEVVIAAVIQGTANFETLAAANGVDSFHIELISRRLQELRGDVPEPSTFSFISEEGYEISHIRFERTMKGNIHLLATVNGREEKFVITPKKEVYQSILDAGFNRMPNEQKKALVEQYLLAKMRNRT